MELLQNKMGYNFYNPTLLLQALTHRSASSKHNERLEFLGDAILNYAITCFLYRHFPYINEGNLSKMRAFLVRDNALANIAKKFELSNYLQLGYGELKSGGLYRESILANTIEALIGGIYLDSNIIVAKRIIMLWYRIKLCNIIYHNNIVKDPKTKLQEYLQSRNLPLPIYSIKHIFDNKYKKDIIVHCKVSGLSKLISGNGMNRQKAEQIAAKRIIRILEIL